MWHILPLGLDFAEADLSVARIVLVELASMQLRHDLVEVQSAVRDFILTHATCNLAFSGLSFSRGLELHMYVIFIQASRVSW